MRGIPWAPGTDPLGLCGLTAAGELDRELGLGFHSCLPQESSGGPGSSQHRGLSFHLHVPVMALSQPSSKLGQAEMEGSDGRSRALQGGVLPTPAQHPYRAGA